MGDFSRWLKLSADISSNSSHINIAHCCPECQSQAIDFQYVGDIASRVGFLAVWCNSCLNGIHLSRVRVPESAVLMAFDDASVKERIPAFKQVVR
jgi:hypothetical protein